MLRPGVLVKRWPRRRLTATTLPMDGSAGPEHALEDGIDVLEVIAEVELFGDFRVVEILLHIGVFFQQALEIAFAAPHRHGAALYEFVGVLAASAFLRQRDQ